MKRSLMILAAMALYFSASSQTTAESIAAKIAQKMKDSLSLSETQKSQLYSINMEITTQKAAMRQQYAGSDLLAVKIQQEENKRDSLYRPVLTEQQYLLYRQKKRYLINNN